MNGKLAAFMTFVWIAVIFLGTTYDGATPLAGTATFTITSTTVTGGGTAWTDAIEGGFIKSNATGTWYKITAVNSVTNMTITPAYVTATENNVAYSVVLWGGTSSAGYDEAPMTTLSNLVSILQSETNLSTFDKITFVVSKGGNIWDALFRVMTWRFSFTEQLGMFYWIAMFPFAMMGVIAMIMFTMSIVQFIRDLV